MAPINPPVSLIAELMRPTIPGVCGFAVWLVTPGSVRWLVLGHCRCGWAHEQNRHTARRQHGARHTAQHCTTNSRAAMRCHHHEVSAAVDLGDCNAWCRIAYAYIERDMQIG